MGATVFGFGAHVPAHRRARHTTELNSSPGPLGPAAFDQEVTMQTYRQHPYTDTTLRITRRAEAFRNVIFACAFGIALGVILVLGVR